MRAYQKTVLVLASAALCAFALCSEPMQADPLDFTLSATTVSGPAGTTVQLLATLTNTGSDTISISGDSFSIASVFLTGDDTPFFNFLFSAASTLAPGATTGPMDILDIAISSLATPGLYGSNSFTVDWMDSTGASFVTSQNFSASVTSAIPTPEPGAFLQLVVGLGAVALGFRRWGRTQSPVPKARQKLT